MGLPDLDWAKRCFGILTGCLAALHLVLGILFGTWHQWLLVVVNAACLLLEAGAFFLLQKDFFRTHLLTLYGAELVHLIFCAICLGRSAGFLLPLVGLAALAFFGEYLGRSLQISYVPALPLGIACFAVSLLLFRGSFHAPGEYDIPASEIASLQFIWSLLVFAMILVCLFLAVRMSSDSERVLTNKAQTDRLTGLYNRAGYDYLRAKVNLKTTALLLVDADKFKGVNDTYGHEAGDLVLRKIARELRKSFRQQDCVCRIGGDEFAVLMLDTEVPGEDMMSAKISRINRELSHTVDDKLPLISISVGFSHGSDAEDWAELFNRADAALYKVKQDGGRGCRFYKETE